MSVQSNSVYSEKLPVSQSDVEELADPFETGLNRTLLRVAGFILGVIPGSMLADACVDHLKGKKIRSQIDQLDTAARDPKANPDVFIEKEICSSIQRYTDRSKTIKTVSGLAGIVCNFPLDHAFRNAFDAHGNVDLLKINYTSLKASLVLVLICMGGFCYSVVRRYTEGLQLQADNMTLASRLSYAKRKQI